MPDILNEKHKKRSSSHADKKSKKNGGLLTGPTDIVKKEAKSASKKSQSIPHQVNNELDQTKGKVRDAKDKVDDAKVKVEGTKDKVDDTRDKVEQTIKDQAQQLGIPEHLLSSDFMQQADFDDSDSRKLMKDIMEYNKKFLAQQQIDSEAETKSDQEEPEEPKTQKEQQALPVNEPVTEQMQTEMANDLNKSIESNVKIEPSENKATEIERSLKDLVGKTVDKAGNIVNDSGNTIGKVTGDITNLVGKIVSEGGNIVDDQGSVIGKAHVADSKEVNGVKVLTENSGQSGKISLRNGDSDVVIKVDATTTGISFSIHIPRLQWDTKKPTTAFCTCDSFYLVPNVFKKTSMLNLFGIVHKTGFSLCQTLRLN